jgi:hypothetical protein
MPECRFGAVGAAGFWARAATGSASMAANVILKVDSLIDDRMMIPFLAVV